MTEEAGDWRASDSVSASLAESVLASSDDEEDEEE